MLLDGVKFHDGMTIKGLGKVNPNFKTHNIIAQKLLPINASTVDKLAALGL